MEEPPFPIFPAAFEASTVPSVVVDSTSRVVEVNEAYLQMTGRTREVLVGRPTIDLIHADDLPGVVAGLDQLAAGVRSVRHRRRHRREDGTWIVIEVCTSMLAGSEVDGDGLLLVQVVDHDPIAVDIDRNGELMTRQLFQPVGDAACLHDADGRVAFGSPSIDAILGRDAGWVIGRRLSDLELDPVHLDGSPVTIDHDPALRALADPTEVSATLGVRSDRGDRIWLAVVAGSVPQASLPVRTSLRDITDLVEAQAEARRLAAVVEEQLAYRANHDDLTGLSARGLVVGLLDEELGAGRPMSVVFVDLDGFKAINDELGHLAGDDLLVAVAQRLTALAPDGLIVGRAGGDEFIGVTSSSTDADEFAARVRAAAASDQGMVEGSPLRIGASVGVAHAEDGETRTDLLTRADVAMYEVKRTAARRRR